MFRSMLTVGVITLAVACSACGGSGGSAGGGGPATSTPAGSAARGPSVGDGALTDRLNADIGRLDAITGAARNCTSADCLVALAHRLKRFTRSEARALRAQVADAEPGCVRAAGMDVAAALREFSRVADASMARDFTAADQRLADAQADLGRAGTTLADCPA